jgi:methylamine utilization protein MauE
MTIMLQRLLPGLVPLVVAALLGWTGSFKLLGRRTARVAAGSALARLLPGPRTATVAMRLLGACELAVAAALVLGPRSPATAVATLALGAGFTAYLCYITLAAPQSSCGCASSRPTPVTWRSYARAGLVAAAGACCLVAGRPWWADTYRRPALSALTVLAVAAVTIGVSSELDRVWLLPLRRARVRLLGHPLARTAGPVPVAATVELLERSLAWQAMVPVVRSALADHWDSDGWRILRYSGVHDGGGGPRPVCVLFAIDASATLETAAEPAVRVSVVDDESEELIPTPSLEATRRPLLPLAAPDLAGA